MLDENQAAPGVAGNWDGAMLVPVAEINGFMLEILCATAAVPGEASPRLVTAMRELWCGLDAGAQQRLAQCPYLLLDAGFACRERWERLALERGVMDGGGSRRLLRSPHGTRAPHTGVRLASGAFQPLDRARCAWPQRRMR